MSEHLEAMYRQYEVEQFYYEEAALLDDRRFTEWLALLAADIHYWMPIRRTVMADDLENELTKPGSMAYFDDDKALLEARVRGRKGLPSSGTRQGQRTRRLHRRRRSTDEEDPKARAQEERRAQRRR